MDKMGQPNREDATHNLSCRHCIGRRCREYTMDCIILKKLPNGRLKVLVFGDRDWKGHDEKSRIRYVDGNRVSTKTP